MLSDFRETNKTEMENISFTIKVTGIRWLVCMWLDFISCFVLHFCYSATHFLSCYCATKIHLNIMSGCTFGSETLIVPISKWMRNIVKWEHTDTQTHTHADWQSYCICVRAPWSCPLGWHISVYIKAGRHLLQSASVTATAIIYICQQSQQEDLAQSKASESVL